MAKISARSEWCQKVTLTCQHCQHEFQASNRTARWCPGCRPAMYAAGKYARKPFDASPRPCVVCGEMFVPARPIAKYCSKTCAVVGNKKNMRGALRSNKKRNTTLRELVAVAMDSIPAGEMPEDVFGRNDESDRDDTGADFMPTPTQIVAGCAVIQSRWSAVDEEKRLVYKSLPAAFHWFALRRQSGKLVRIV